LHIDEISKGGAVELEVKYEGKSMNFSSEVVLITNNSVLVTSITVNDQTIGFSDKYQVNLLYKVESKLYIWEKVTAKLVKYDGGIYHKIDLQGEGKVYNRRNSYRLYIGEEMPLYVNTAEGPTALSVLLKDISESGFAFITKEDLEVSRSVRLKLTDESIVINLSALILRKEFLENRATNLYGCKLTERNPKLSKYIVKKQADALKKRNEPMSYAKDKPLKEKAGKEPQAKNKKIESIEKK